MATQHPPVHSVHIYDSDSDMISRLAAIVCSNLRLGDSALIMATPEHRAELIEHLEEAGINVRARVREGRYTMLDAREGLSMFMRHGRPDRELFSRSIVGTLEAIRSSAAPARRNLAVFGEMVALLWGDGLKDAALELESLWNSALQDSAFHLHCAYPRAVFGCHAEVSDVCGAHSHVLGDRPDWYGLRAG